MLRTVFFCLALWLSYGLLAQDSKPFAKEIEQFAHLDAQFGFPEKPVLFVGSSSIRKWNELDSIYKEYKAINRGFGGSTFQDLLLYTNELIFKYKPSRIFVYEGDNDLAKGDSPELVFSNLQILVEEIRKNLGEVPIILISPKPSVARWNLKQQYETVNAYFKIYADAHEQIYFADVWNPSLDGNGMVFKDIFVSDNLHMNEKGYAIWNKVILPFLQMK